MFVGLMLLSVVLAGFSIIQVLVVSDEKAAMESKSNALKPVEQQYNDLVSIESNYELTEQIKQNTDTNNNHFHELITQISAIVPKSFRIQSIQSDEQKVTISATSADRLSSLPVLRMQLNKIDKIQKVWIDEIAETNDEVTKKRQYTYTLTFYYSKTVSSSEQEVQ